MVTINFVLKIFKMYYNEYEYYDDEGGDIDIYANQLISIVSPLNFSMQSRLPLLSQKPL